MKGRTQTTVIIVVAFVAVWLASAGVGGGAAAAAPPAAKPVIVAGENFYGDVTSQIAGNHVTVISIISDPNADPHEYESSANDAGEIARASLVIMNGLGYDDFVTADDERFAESDPEGHQRRVADRA